MEQSMARRYLDKISEYLTELKNDKRQEWQGIKSLPFIFIKIKQSINKTLQFIIKTI